MNAKLGWALAALAVALGYHFFGWRGVALAASGMVFWMLLQFSRAMRVMRAAGQSPVGTVPSAVMLNARLHAGMRLMNILMLTRSLGEKLADEPETWRWHDGAGDSVQVVLQDGRCSSWTLSRAADTPSAPPAPPRAGL
jgi:Mg2+/Co2+ transporter CorB